MKLRSTNVRTIQDTLCIKGHCEKNIRAHHLDKKKNIHSRETLKKKIHAARKFPAPPPPPHNYSKGPSLISNTINSSSEQMVIKLHTFTHGHLRHESYKETCSHN